MTELHETASQTAGPYVHIGCMPNGCGLTGVYAEDLGAQMLRDETAGERISVTGLVLDGTGAPLKDALIEVWQADADGDYGNNASGFTGWGRVAADDQSGQWRIDTIKPGAVANPPGPPMAPHLTLWIVARGINIGLHTRIYFPEDGEAQAEDPVLAKIEQKARLSTLIAKKVAEGIYDFNIHLQGPQETVFFDV